MSRVLITGAAGFVGRHLARELRAAGVETIGFDVPEAPAGEGLWETGRVEDGAALAEIVARRQPDACVHLAGVASEGEARRAPERAVRVNIEGTVALLEAFRARRPDARVLVVSTSQVYGETAGGVPLTEEAPLTPVTLYGLTKMAADRIALYYAAAHGLAALTARPVNHIGPGQSERYVVAAFARQLADIAAGRRAPELRVGNLESRRAFMDVRDTVRGYRLLLERGTPGRAYNLSCERSYAIGETLDLLCQIAGVCPRRVVDPALYRPTDGSPLLDTGRIRSAVGWRPEIPFEQTLRDIYEDARARPADGPTRPACRER